MLSSGGDVRARSDNLKYSLHYAVESGKISHVQLLLKAGAPLFGVSIDGISPLHESLYRGHSEIANLLMKEGAVIDLHAAAGLGNMKQAQRFLRAKPQKWNRFQGDSGRTPLIYAIIGGHTEMVKYLLSHQSDTDRISHEHLKACLSKAIHFERTGAAVFILDQKLLKFGKRPPQTTPSLHPQVPPEMRFWGMGPEPLLHDSALKNNRRILEGLLKRGWDVDSLNADEVTPLHIAAESGSVDAIHALLEGGANLEAKSGEERRDPCGPPESDGRKNQTALHLAVIGRKVDAVKLLLEKGAKVNPLDTYGQTPLMYLLTQNRDAAELKKIDQLFRILMNSGADPDLKDELGRTLKTRASKEVADRKKIDGKWKTVGKRSSTPELLELLKEFEKK